MLRKPVVEALTATAGATLGSDKADVRTTRRIEEFSIMISATSPRDLRLGGGEEGAANDDESEEAIVLQDRTEVARGQVFRPSGYVGYISTMP